MRHIRDFSGLSPEQTRALEALQKKLCAVFEIDAFIVYGSVVRGEADAESDLDLLIVTEKPLSRIERHQITDMVWEINLQYETNINTLFVDREAWTSGPVSVLPIHDTILNEGVRL